ncbi:acetyl-CoA carboxylase carboxyltransferase subunit alpha [Rubrobacter calidifluminis]|uniref:acetyl-CoA carboxylase carboxyltransferase subunit alpha n=1 Tax=Rubrobacter calidifluminis TaxID=1392640 RepID=UPI00235E4187|nr:acetyl-CoA carboxylase carboxyltransferase subunit alpha [Rubrobacter calidifluminis]
MILDFERPIKELEDRILELQRLAGESEELQDEISNLQRALETARKRIYLNLTPYQRVQISRHPERPNFRTYVEALTEDFYELSGDRHYGEDVAVSGGLARLKEGGRRVVLVGNDKGRDVKSRVRTNFGMAHPEGYRKLRRLYALAARFGLPVVSLVDTPGAFAGRGAEERGQAWAISEDLLALARSPVPVVSVITGEGGSGGALAMCLADYLGILENSYLSVIAPESCASIIFRDPSRAEEAAEAMRITAEDLAEHGIVDEVIPEPLGGAHKDPAPVVEAVGGAIGRALERLEGIDPAALFEMRYRRYRAIGAPKSLEAGRNGHHTSRGRD